MIYQEFQDCVRRSVRSCKRNINSLGQRGPEISDLLDYPFGKVLVDDQDEWVRIGLVNSNVLKTAKLSERAAQNNAKASIGGHYPKY